MARPSKTSLEELSKRVARVSRSEGVTAREAQAAVAGEYGFPDWQKLKAYVQRITRNGPKLQHTYRADTSYYEDRVRGLLTAAQNGERGVAAAFERWNADLDGVGARTVIAREHGFGSWTALLAHVVALAENGEPFARAYQAVEAHDEDRLAALLTQFPELAKARGTNGNDLLSMAVAAGDESLTRLLLTDGGSPSRANTHGWTALHQAAYIGRPSLAKLLLDAGARTDVSGRGDGGTPLVVALYWGHRETAALLARHDLAPGNLRVAAGLGRDSLVRTLLAKDGEPTAEAGAHRAFYRPNGGFPDWRPSKGAAEIRDEALAWAARNDRVRTLELLVRRGADVNADVYRGTALAWAAATGRAESVRKLIELGADVNQLGTFGSTGHGSGITALHLAVQGDNVDVVRALLDAGADRSIQDELYGDTPAGWAEQAGSTAVLELLQG
jgi:ankyrin repeat protein